MEMNGTYGVNEAKAISETLDGETIIINIENGNYYSMNESGSLLWELLRARHPLPLIRDHFVARYDADPALIEQALTATLTTLWHDGLIVPAENGSTELPNPTGKEPFSAPAIERYEDMQEMLLADPIHDVDETGWPTLKPKHE